MTHDVGVEAAADTSLQRTYRYLRLGVAGTAVVIAVAVGVAAVDAGVLGSISAYYYTPAQVPLVGALVAASLGLFALSGRGIQRGLLDAAALFAPLVAVVPTPILAVAGAPVCGGDACVPEAVHPAVDNGVTTYLIVGAVVIAVAALLGLRADAGQAALTRTWPSIVLAAVVLGSVWAWWALGRESFLGFAHFVATVVFFAILAVVALLDARRTDWAPESAPTRAVRVGYGLVAVLMPVDLLVLSVFVAVGGPERTAAPVVFVCEFIALGLFFTYWVLRTTHTWNQPDPSLVASVR